MVDSIVEVVKNDENELKGLYYQCKSIATAVFQIILIDATYKLNVLRMSFLLWMVMERVKSLLCGLSHLKSEKL